MFGVKSTDSLPLHVAEQDGTTYFIKAIHHRPTKFRNRTGVGDPLNKPGHYMRRTLINDQIALRLGRLLDTPTPVPAIVRLSPELLGANDLLIRQDIERSRDRVPFAVNFEPGFCHGSLEIEGLGERQNFPQRFDTYPNPQRYASLAVLYALLGINSDYQFFLDAYGTDQVWSIDHGFALGGHPVWTPCSLRKGIPAPTILDQFLVRHANLEASEVRRSVLKLRSIKPKAINRVVSKLPNSWITPRERWQVAKYLNQRRLDLIRSNWRDRK